MNNSDWILLANAITTTIAVLIAPLIALWIGGKLQKASELKNQKLNILGVLISLRHDPLASDALRSLNLIDAVFTDNFEVREAWTRYFAVLSDNALGNPVGFSLREEKRHELLLRMVDAVNLKGKISSADLLRAYTPTAVGNQNIINYWDQQIKLQQLEKIFVEQGIPFTPMSAFNHSTPHTQQPPNTPEIAPTRAQNSQPSAT